MDCFQGNRQLKATGFISIKTYPLVPEMIKSIGKQAKVSHENARCKLLEMIVRKGWGSISSSPHNADKVQFEVYFVFSVSCWGNATKLTVKVYLQGTCFIFRSRSILFLAALWKDLLFPSLPPAHSASDLQILSIKASA